MQNNDIEMILKQLHGGDIEVSEALAKVYAAQNDVSTNSAVLDLGRRERCGFPEFIFGEGKTREQLVEIVGVLQERGENVLATRVDKSCGEHIAEVYTQGTYCEQSRCFYIMQREPSSESTDVCVVTAGTTDLPVAYEALHTLNACEVTAELVTDVGVAGVHRLFDKMERLRNAKIIIVVAGMEGALPSLIGGLVDVPVIAVPTSVGYGAAFNGVAALLGMLTSCASGITVVNIDNGFGAGCAAKRMLQLAL